MAFIKYVMIALLLLLSGAAVTALPYLASQWTVGWTSGFSNLGFGVGAIGSQFWIFYWALVLRKRRTPNFDMIVASELLIAFGVFSLIIGIAVSGMIALNDVKGDDTVTADVLRKVLAPFGEGLLVSGLGPLLSSLLRQIEVLRYNDEGNSAGDSESPDLPSLVDKVREAVGAMDRFVATWKRSERALKTSGETLEASAGMYDQSARRIKIVLSGMAANVEVSGKRFVGEVDRSAESFGRLESRVRAAVDSLLTRGSEGMSKLHSQAEISMRDFNGRSSEAATTLGDFSGKMRALSGAAHETTALLLALRNTIEGVTNIVDADRIVAAWKRGEDALNQSSETLTTSAAIYGQAASHIEATLSSMAGNVESSGKRLIGEVDRTSASFSGLENGLNKLLGHADNGMRDLNGRTTEAAATLADLSDKIQVLSRSAQEVTTLLSGLIKVIADVNNFIHADDSWHR